MTDTPAPFTRVIDYSQFPTLAVASRSNAYAKIVVGPAGSAKTSWMFQYILEKAATQAPAADGTRYTRVTIVRNTYELLENTTLKTAQNCYGDIARFVFSKPPRGEIKQTLADGTRIHLELDFLAMDAEDSLAKLLGREMTFVILDEVSELSENVFWGANRRVGRYPSGSKGVPSDMGIVAATNGPLESHWLYQWTLGAKTATFRGMAERLQRPFVHIFQQPPGLIRPRERNQWNDPSKWLPNPRAENIANLPGGYEYYFKMLAEDMEQGDQHIKAYVEGKFAKLRLGKVVFTEFSRDAHVIPADTFNLPEAATLGLSFDFGRTPVGLLWYEAPSGRMIVVDEFMMDNASVEDLMAERIAPALRERYPRSSIGWATGDPAGMTEGEGTSLSPYDVLKGEPYNLPMESPPIDNRIEPRLDSMRRAMKTLDRRGIPVFGVLESCKFLIDSLENSFVYTKARDGSAKEKPTGSHVNWCSDVAAAACYGTLYKATLSSPPIVSFPKKKARRLC